MKHETGYATVDNGYPLPPIDAETTSYDATHWRTQLELHRNHAGDGLWLERCVANIGTRIPEWDLAAIHSWRNWNARTEHFPSASQEDLGIDLVGERSDGNWVAIQCKARQQGSKLTANELNSFSSATQDSFWQERWVVSNVPFGNKLEKKNQLFEESRQLRHVDIATALDQLAHSSIRIDPALTEMQDEAVAQTLHTLRKGYGKEGRTKWRTGETRTHIVMPCGTGKTRVAYRTAKALVSAGEIVVVLVPSIALVAQLKREFQTLARYDGWTIRTLAVCSDRTAGKEKKVTDTEPSTHIEKHRDADVSNTRTYELVGDTATNEEEVIDWLRTQQEDTHNAALAVFSTYQSSHNTAAGLHALDTRAKLVVCDEAHRTAGFKRIKPNEDGLRNFTLCHDSAKFPAQYRLYQTATPRVYKSHQLPKREMFESESNWDVKSMDDIDTFGREGFRLSYKDAVEQNLLSDYRIIGWCIDSTHADEAQTIAEKLNAERTDETGERWTKDLAMRALMLAAFMAGGVKSNKDIAIGVQSVIAFSNRIDKSAKIASAIGSDPVKEWLEKYFKAHMDGVEPKEIQAQHIDAKHAMATRQEALRKLANATPDKPFCISNVGIFGEGTDSPDLSAVAFLQARTSPVDVVQAVGRAMRKSPNKTLGYILVPIVIPPNRDAETFLRDSMPGEGWSELGQILAALRAHDGRIEDYLADLLEVQLPPTPTEPKNHLVVTHEFNQPPQYILTRTKRPIENLLQKKNADDGSSIVERIKERTTSKVEFTRKRVDLDTSALEPQNVTAVRTDKKGDVYVRDKTSELTTAQHEGQPVSYVAETVDGSIRKDKQRSQPQMRPLPVRKKKNDVSEEERLGNFLVEKGGKTLLDQHIHLNLLEQSGIRSGSARDVNVLQRVVEGAAWRLREAELEPLVAEVLEMDLHADTGGKGKGKNKADACTVTAVIWVNATLMHARLERSTSVVRKETQLKDVLNTNVPADPISNAWEKILRKDYLPIFDLAKELLHKIVIGHGLSEALSDTLHWIVKYTLEIDATYSQLNMDHAGELFNKVMGNQQSDGAFFTTPIAAAMLAEAALHAAELDDFDWLNEDQWKELTVFDPACGSGTLLVAMLTAMKQRITLAGGTEETLHTFHKFAVDKLIVGADINRVSLQLAGCQLTLGDISSDYEDMRLYPLEYGVDEHEQAHAGSVELLEHEAFDVRDVSEPTAQNLQLQETRKLDKPDARDLGDYLAHTSPPRFVLMNPPYTKIVDVAKKFIPEVQRQVREKIYQVWDDATPTSLVLDNKKTSMGLLFEELAYQLARHHGDAVTGMVRPLTVLTAGNSHAWRVSLANAVHIDTIIVTHHPRAVNMSWDTAINECLLVMSRLRDGDGELDTRPTKFITLHQPFSSVEEATSTLREALKGNARFNGSVFEWDYNKMRQGDWSPGVFGEPAKAMEMLETLSDNTKLRTDLIGSGNLGGIPVSDTISRRHRFSFHTIEIATRKVAAPMKKYQHFDHEVPYSIPVISGSGGVSNEAKVIQTQLQGVTNKWVRLTRLEHETEQEWHTRIEEDKSRLNAYTSHLLLTRSFSIRSSRLAAIASPVKRIGYSWIPVIKGNRERAMSFEKAQACAVWLNSSVGRLVLRQTTARKLEFPRYAPVAYDTIPFPDVINHASVMNVLSNAYSVTHDMEVPQFREGRVPIRELWDDAVAKALDIDRAAIAECADMLARDPYVSGEALG